MVEQTVASYGGLVLSAFIEVAGPWLGRAHPHLGDHRMSKPSSMYINRELSWLEFNQRVLDESLDRRIPPLERLKFLAITGSNLDEFFMVRVGGLQMLGDRNPGKRDAAGMTAREQLAAISRRCHAMVDDQYRCFLEDLEPALAAVGIRRLSASTLDDQQRVAVAALFERDIFAVMTPMVVGLGEQFPLLVSQNLVACVELAPLQSSDEPRFALIPLGSTIDRIVALPCAGEYHYLLLEDVLQMHVHRFFPGLEVRDCTIFRVTRNADMRVQEDSASDLLSGMQQVLIARKQSACVRLEIAAGAGATIREFLQRALRIHDGDVYGVPGPLNLSAFMRMSGLPGYDHLRYEPWPPQPSPLVDPQVSIFDTIAHHDVVLFQPYESYEPVVRFVEEAADDPHVLAIKQILYRTSRNSPIVAALKRAAENGKHVTAIVELKARFDEARNIDWAKRLEAASVQVIYGVKGLKTHAKICIVLRREPTGIRRYVHYGTGNYNEITARLYSDVSFMTCDEELTRDGINFFNAITGYSQPQAYRKIESAPLGLRERILDLIEGETRLARHHQPALIMAQFNSLVDAKVINALYRASRAGVKIQLNVRGICCLRPGVPGISENIRVVSILDRYLEHSRIIYFLAGGKEMMYISSADWMPRNLLRRVELFVPVEDHDAKQRLKRALESYARDNVKGRCLRADGRYDRIRGKPGQPPHRHQQSLYELAAEASRQPAKS
ncbi:MAG: polyphosphate kinase 1 [Pirellulaceae bacterium]